MAAPAPTPAPGTAGYRYPIGTPGIAWGEPERKQWLAHVGAPQRLYAEHVLHKLEPLRAKFDVSQYGQLDYSSVVPGGFGARYPLMCIRSRGWVAGRPTVLLTGGVHGYETSGVQGVLLFCATRMQAYADKVNFLVAPCVSPWGYEHVQRWTAAAVDPNRGFHPGTPVEECAALQRLIASAGAQFPIVMHVDCHETTLTDETEFAPAREARDGGCYVPQPIPDGFYLVGDSANPQPAWHKAMIEAVRAVTHIAPADAQGQLLGDPIAQEGVVVCPVGEIHLCSSATGAQYATTTEVFPDSPTASDEQCNAAQVACIVGGLDFVLAAAAAQ